LDRSLPARRALPARARGRAALERAGRRASLGERELGVAVGAPRRTHAAHAAEPLR